MAIDDEIDGYRRASECRRTCSRSPVAAAIRDPKDQAVIEAAFAGEADIICTSDAHFQLSPACEFLKEHGVSVLDDNGLLTLLQATVERR